MKAIGMIAVVMMVSRLRVTWRRDRPSRTAVSLKKCVFIVVPYSLLVGADGPVIASVAALGVGADDSKEDVFEGRLLLDVFDLGGREQVLEFDEGAVHDDPTLVEDRDPVNYFFRLVQTLRRHKHRHPRRLVFLYGLPKLEY